MAEKVLEFEGGTANADVTGGSGAVSGLNSVANSTGGITRFSTAAALSGILGISITNQASFNATSRIFIDPAGATLATTTTKMLVTMGFILPDTVPTETETFAEGRLLPSAGGPRVSYTSAGVVNLASPVSGGGTFTLLTSAERAALPNRAGILNLSFDSTSGITTTAFTAKCYTAAGVLVGTPQSGTINYSASGAMAGWGVGRIIGLTASRTYMFDHLGINNGVSTGEIPFASTRLTNPTLTKTDRDDPNTLSGLDGSITLSWPPVSGASRYDAYRAIVAGVPGQGDFSLFATDIVSPYQFTGQGVGTFHYGIKAVV